LAARIIGNVNQSINQSRSACSKPTSAHVENLNGNERGRLLDDFLLLGVELDDLLLLGRLLLGLLLLGLLVSALLGDRFVLLIVGGRVLGALSMQ